MMEESMRKKGENSAKCAGKSAIPPDKIMIPPLAAKVNNPPHLPDFAAHRDCSAAEAAPAARRVPPAGALGTLRLPRGNKGTIGHEEHTSRMPRREPFASLGANRCPSSGTARRGRGR